MSPCLSLRPLNLAMLASLLGDSVCCIGAVSTAGVAIHMVAAVDDVDATTKRALQQARCVAHVGSFPVECSTGASVPLDVSLSPHSRAYPLLSMCCTTCRQLPGLRPRRCSISSRVAGSWAWARVIVSARITCLPVRLWPRSNRDQNRRGKRFGGLLCPAFHGGL